MWHVQQMAHIYSHAIYTTVYNRTKYINRMIGRGGKWSKTCIVGKPSGELCKLPCFLQLALCLQQTAVLGSKASKEIEKLHGSCKALARMWALETQDSVQDKVHIFSVKRPGERRDGERQLRLWSEP